MGHIFSYSCLFPPGQKKPFGHVPEGADSPAVLQNEPGYIKDNLIIMTFQLMG
jgi:hypothetical protein